MNPSLKEQLKEWKRQHQVKTPKKKRRRKAKNQGKFERLTESDIKSLMGVNRPIYTRKKGGAYRQR